MSDRTSSLGFDADDVPPGVADAIAADAAVYDPERDPQPERTDAPWSTTDPADHFAGPHDARHNEADGPLQGVSYFDDEPQVPEVEHGAFDGVDYDTGATPEQTTEAPDATPDQEQDEPAVPQAAPSTPDTTAEAGDATQADPAHADPEEAEAEEAGDPPADPVQTATRQLRVIGAVGVVVTVLGLLTMFAPFYRAHVPDFTLRTRAGQHVQYNGAGAEVTAWGLTHQEQPQASDQLRRAEAGPRPDDAGGLPKPHALLLVMASLALAGQLLRMTLPSLLGVGAGVLAFKALTSLRGVVEGARSSIFVGEMPPVEQMLSGRIYITDQWGLTAFTVLLGFTFMVLLAQTVQTFVLNRRVREALVAEYEERGEQPPATTFQQLSGLLARQLTRFLEMGQDATNTPAPTDPA